MGVPMKTTKEPEFFSKQVTQAKRFFMENTAAGGRRIKVVCGGCEQTQPGFKIDRKDFPYYSLEFVAKGRGTAMLAGRKYDLIPGTIFSYGGQISHVITADPQHAMTKYFINFVGGDARQVLRKLAAPAGTAVQVSRPDEIIRIFDDLISQGLSDSPYKSAICSVLLEYLFYKIAQTKVTDQARPIRALVTYQICRQHIKENFIKLNSLQEIADSCAIDRAYLCRLFKRFDTQSPYHYLMSLKMTTAAERLHGPDVLVKEIAFELGFEDPFHFSRAFKKVFGVSPQSFKKLR
jgi:AraC-like DNA-binding protein